MSDREVSGPTEMQSSPYLGLRPFEASDTPFFFGRRRECDLLAANLRSSRTTLVYGESGVGKSSLLRAGLGPVLNQRSASSLSADHEGESFAVVIVPMNREDPTPDLVKAIASAVGVRDGMLTPESSLVETFEAATEKVGRVLVVLDQFEQYLEYSRSAGSDRFADDLIRAVSRIDLPVHFLIVIREDLISRLDRFGSATRELTANPIRIEPLMADAAHEAIQEPLNAYNRIHGTGHRIEPEFAQAVIDATRVGALDLGFGGRGGEQPSAVNGNVAVEAAYLQLVLRSTWDAECEGGSQILRLQTFEKLGGVPGIVRSHLDRIMGRLDHGNQRIAADVFRYLVTPSGMKVPYSAWDLSEMTGEEAGKVEEVLGHLAEERARIVRPLAPSPRGDRRYEIYHDRLGDPILDWCARFTRGDDRALSFRRIAALASALSVLAALFLFVADVPAIQRSMSITLAAGAVFYAVLATPVGARVPELLDRYIRRSRWRARSRSSV